MSFSATSCLECSFSGYPNTDQTLIVRFGSCSRLISQSPSPEIIPDVILEQTPFTLIGEALFSLSNLRCPLQQQELQYLVNEFLHSFNLRSSVCRIISHNILSFAQQFDINNEWVKIEANVDHIKEYWTEAPPELNPISTVGEEGLSPRGASESAIERVKKQKLDWFSEEEEEEIGDCCVCCEEMKRKGEEVRRIPCGHVYHKSCILKWLEISNSCPLCRAALEP
ncbi:RING finger protein 165-like protein [Cucumis melo var. makuwa]|uniref:RING finger protein 165-like n=2 Tax=Cucumis melo TaxID=3656 RepID=A0A5D3CSM6_CUCMM|nr:RING finger protein 165-like [Cucumis melo var. makuwa]TYK14831.1 RING finger protein 165-like protein [Cucumis melo var. makuwa]